MGMTYNTNIVRDGLVACYDPANSKSYSGIGNPLKNIHGALANSAIVSNTTFNTVNGGILVYGASQASGVVNVYPEDVGLGLLNETYTFWAKCDFPIENALGGGFTNWIMQWGGYYTNGSGGFGLHDGLFYRFYKGESGAGWSASGISAEGKLIYETYGWILYSVVITGNNNIKVYMNNTLVSDNTLGIVYSGFSSNLIVIGRDVDMSLGPINLYNKPLSEAEISQNFEATRGRYGI